jgi:hypothetical protein
LPKSSWAQPNSLRENTKKVARDRRQDALAHEAARVSLFPGGKLRQAPAQAPSLFSRRKEGQKEHAPGGFRACAHCGVILPMAAATVCPEQRTESQSLRPSC